MTLRRMFILFALAALPVLPPVASAAVVEKWHTGNGTIFDWEPEVSGDLDGNGSYELVTIEAPSAKIAIRSASTGAVLAQTAGSYQATDFQIADVDGNGDAEILFTDANTNLVCLHYAVGSLTVRFNYSPTSGVVPSNWAFADLDGNGHLYLIFKATNDTYYVRDNNGGLVATLNPAAPPGSGWTSYLLLGDYDGDARQEIMIDYRNLTGGDFLYVYESNAPALAQAAVNRAPISRGPLRVDGTGVSLATGQRSARALRPIEPVYVDGSR